MTARLSNMQPRHGRAVPGARRKQRHPELRRPISAPMQRIGGMLAPRAPACCIPGGIEPLSTLSQEFKWGILANNCYRGMTMIRNLVPSFLVENFSPSD